MIEAISNKGFKGVETPSPRYPDIVPTSIDDVEILELEKDYYMDKFNNVYQITEDDEIGIFLGVHDKINNNIIYMEN